MNGHVTFVAPRVGGQIARVLVDDNNRVHKGDLLAELEYDRRQEGLSTAGAQVTQALAAVHQVRASFEHLLWGLAIRMDNTELCRTLNKVGLCLQDRRKGLIEIGRHLA